MSQIYPSPTIYTYRVTGFGITNGVLTPVTLPTGGITYGQPANPPPPCWYLPEFSSNSGTSWAPATNNFFHSLQEAYQQIAFIVGNEAYFAANTASLVAQPQHFSYPQ